MARVLGMVEYGSDKPNRYFIHCNTSGWSIPPLFADPEDACLAYEQSEGKGESLRAAVPQQSTRIYAVRKLLARGRSFDEDGSTSADLLFGITTDDRLLWPLAIESEEDCRALLRVDGMLHVVREEYGDFAGVYDQPICKKQWTPSARGERLGFESVFGQALDLCPDCAKKLLNKGIFPKDPLII